MVPVPPDPVLRARLITSDGPGQKPRADDGKSGVTTDRVVVDPTKGGAVEAKAAQQSKALEVQPGQWPWDGVVKVLEVDLFSTAWEVRHGAALALREIIKVQGKCGGMRGNYFPYLNSFDSNIVLLPM